MTTDVLDLQDILAFLNEGRLTILRQAIGETGDTGRIFYSECLAALELPGGRMLRAGAFVPQLERANMIHVLDRHVLERVMTDLESDRQAVNGCNISACSFLYPAPWQALLETVRAHAAVADRLVIEITESLPLLDLSVVSARMAELKALGCRIAIDDFGAGHASPSVVLSVEFDVIKVDAAFVRTIRIASDGQSSLAHIVGMARCFAGTVVIEGIETEDQLAFARAAGASHVQGYLIDRPRLIPRPPSPECRPDGFADLLRAPLTRSIKG